MINDKPQDYPEYGDHVTLTRYTQGSAHTGDLANPDLVVTGTVVETPRSGSKYLVIMADREVSGERRFDPSDPEAWSIVGENVTLSIPALWNWSIEPAKPEAAIITAVVDLRGVPAEQLMLTLRGTLRGLGCELLPHTFGPDVDTVADCAGVESVTAIEIA